MSSGKGRTIAPATGKLGILLPGMGAVATTFIAGVEAIRIGLVKPVGSVTQTGTIRLGKRTENRSPKINEFVPLAKLDDVVFGGWDIFEEDCYAAACTAGVLELPAGTLQASGTTVGHQVFLELAEARA